MIYLIESCEEFSTISCVPHSHLRYELQFLLRLDISCVLDCNIIEIEIDCIMQAPGRCCLENEAVLKPCRWFIVGLVLHTKVTCFHESIFTAWQIYFLLNIATAQKKEDRIARGSVQWPSATQVQARAMVCAKPCLDDRRANVYSQSFV